MAKKYWWEEDENQPANQNQTQTGQSSQGQKTYWWEPENVASTIGNNILSRVNNWVAKHNTYLSDYQNRYSGRNFNYDDAYVSDSASWLDNVSKLHSDYQKEADDILAYMDQYKDYLDADWVNDIKNALVSGNEQRLSVITSATEDNKYWSQWKTEDEYKAYAQESKDYYNKWGHYAESEDFDEYKVKGTEVSNPSWDDSKAPVEIFGWKPFGDGADVGNMVTFAEANKEKASTASAQAIRGGKNTDEETKLINAINLYMKDEEKGIYNYLIGKGETERASEYLNSLKDTFAKREAGTIVEQIDETALEAVFSALAGLDSFVSGVKNLDNYIKGDEADTTTSFQYAQSAMSSNNKGVWKVTNDLINTTGNMFPSILVGTITGGLGGVLTMGASAVGNAYAEMRNLGYDEWQSRGYATLVGASEAALSYFLGGISKLGGGSKGIFQTVANKLVPKFDKALARLAIQLGGNMLDEGLEESIQAVLEPAFKALMTGEDFEAPEWEEVFYSGLLGFLSAGVLEGIPATVETSAQTRQERNAGRTIMMADGGVDALKNLANEVAGVSDAEMQKTLTRQAGKVSSETATGKNIVGKAVAAVKNNSNATKVGRLYNTVQSANDLANAPANKADIAKSLERKGFNTETANDIAEALVASYNGQELTKAQEKLLKSAKDNKVVQEAISNIMANPQSTMGQRSQNVRDFQSDIEAGAISKATGMRVEEVKEALKGKPATTEEVVPESHYEVSADGKTIDSKGNVVNIVGIDSIKDGKMVLKTDTGTIDSSEVAYASKADALIYEAVARMDASPASAWTMIKSFKETDGVPAQVYAIDIPLAYKYGKLNYKAGLQNLSLTAGQSATAFQMGRTDAEASVKATTQASTEATISEKNADKKIIFDGFTYDRKHATDTQKASMDAIDMVNKMSNLEVHVYKSYRKNGNLYAMINGKERLAPNGYITDGNKVYIDINAGNMGDGLMLYTLSHEIGHYIARYNAADFKAISDFLFEHYGEDVPIYDLIEGKKETVKNSYEMDGKPIPSEAQLEKEAQEELVCDMLSRMLADKNAYDKLMELKQKDLNAFQKLGKAIKKVLDKIAESIGLYDSLSPDFKWTASAKNFGEEAFRQLQDLYIKAFVQADANFQKAQEQFSTDSIRGGADGAVVQSEVTTALVEATDGEIIKSERTEYEALPKQVMSLSTGAGTLLNFIEGLKPKEIKGIAGKIINGYTGRAVRAYAMGISGFSDAKIEEVNKFMDAMSEFMEKAGVTYKFIGLKDVKDAKLHYTYNADGSIKSIVLSAMVKNGDYPVNFDLSSICKKRVAMSTLIDKLARRGSLDSGTVKLTPANIFKINTALKDAGYETACLGCFVESKRYNSLEWAKTFCNKWNAAVKKVNPNATYFGYGDGTFNEDSFTLEQAVKIDEAATKYITTTKVERLANALKKYKAREQAGLPLVENLSDAAKKRLIKSDTISEELKDKYLNCDVTTLTMADVEFLLENEVLPGASLSNKQAVTEMVKSGEAYQHLLRPSDLLTDRGISKLEALPNFHGVLYGHYGSGTPKLMQSYTPYNSEIALLPAHKNNEQTLAEYLYTIAGVRMQSFSDFQIQNIYDYLQMVADLAARKLPAHAYTKEISFAKLLGMTGIKVNLSVMFDIDPMVDKAHAGLTKLNKLVHRGEYAKVVLEDAQGKWVYNIGDYQTQKLFAEAFPDEAKRFLQSIGFGDAVKLQSSPGYSANCGIIGVGYSDLGIFAMLDDNRIRYIIPYHASSLPAEIKLATNIALGTDYTPYQNNMKIKEIVDRNGNAVNWSIKEAYKRLGSGQAVINELNEKVRNEGWVVTTKKAQTGHGTYGLYEDLQQTNDPRQTAGNFMDWCIGNGTLPLFYQFASHENYYKLLYDFNVYDCVTEQYAPQQAVTNTYPTMVGGQVQPGTVTDGGFNAEYLQGAIDKQMAFMDAYNQNLDEDLDTLAENMEEGNYSIVRFSERETLNQAADSLAKIGDVDYLKAKEEHPFIIVMDHTPEIVLKSMDGESKAADRRVIIRRDALYLAIREDGVQEGHYHGLGEEVLKKLPEYLEQPDVILKTDGSSTKRIVLTSIPVKSGQGIISVEFESIKDFEGEYEYFNVIVTVFDLHKNYLKGLFKKHNAEIKYEKEDLVQVNPQLYEWLRIFNTKPSDDKVSQPKPEVKKFSDRDTMSDRAKEILAGAKPNRIGKNETAGIEFDTVRELFNELNADKDIQALADKVFEVAKEDVFGHYGYVSYPGEPKSHLRLPMAFVGKDGIPDGVHGQFRKNTIWGDVVFSYEYFIDEDVTPQSKASTILHEVIHAVTCSYIENAYNWSKVKQGQWADPTGLTDFNGVDERIKAGIELIDVFEQVRFAPTESGKQLYGQLTAYEMVAEMANVDFRNFLKKQNLWNRIVDAIKRIFGIPKTTAYDAVSDALERILASTTNDADAWRAKSASTTRYSDRILMGSLFSGGGTLEAGLAYQMLDKQFGVEYDGKIASVYADNHGDHIQVGKVEDFDISKYDDIFYLHASPVCHNFSAAKHGATELAMDIASARATAKHLETAMPQVFTVENAPGYRKSQSLKIITDKLTELGYKWDVDVYNSADYGSATSRNRVILRAVKDGELPAKPTKQERTNSWDKVTRDLWDTLPKATLRPSFISAIENTRNLPILDANGKVNVNKPLLILTTTSGHTVTYCWEGDICPTLTTKCGEARLVMPDGNIYAVTPEFMGRIQGLPDDYKYPKEKTRAFTIIGNGIPTHLTKAVVGGVLDSAYEQTHGGDVLYQDRADESVSNRSLLANAFEGLAQNDIEKNKIQEYKSKISLINAEEQKLSELNQQIKELSFAKGQRDTKKIRDLQFEAKQTANRINTYDKQLLRLEASKPLQDVLAREKKRAYQKAEQRGKEALDKYKERAAKTQRELLERWQESRKKAVAKVRETAEKRDAREKLQKLVLDTVNWISYPAKTDVKCPDILKKPYADFLNGIDLSSKRLANGGDPTNNDLRLSNAMDSLATALEKIMTSQDPAQDTDKILDIGYLDLPADFVQKLRDMTESIKTMMVEGEYVVNTMTAAEVRQLSQMIRTLNHAIKTMSKLYANLRFANIETLGFDTMEFIDALGEIEKTGGIKDFVQWDNALPYYAFKRFGKGGESVFEGLMDAQDKLAFLAEKIFAFQENTWTGKEAKEWSEDTHTITLPNGNELTLTTADAMSIYCLSRREQGLQHLLGGGTRVMGIQKGSKKAKDSRSVLTIEDVSAIVSSLTDRQKQVADGIQEFMSTVCSEWGNEISMKRFLTKEFTEKFYFPIESNDENLPTKDPAAQQSDLFRLLNISATKPLTPGANNEVIIRNIFDVFTGHASDMARLNAYGMALLDYMKWLNYREKTTNDEGQVKVRGVRKSMELAFGNAAKSYVLNLIKDVNGRPSDGGDPTILMKWMRAGKTASVGNSLRVATLQVTSYPRAALVLSPKSLALGLSKLPNIDRAKKYCGIALWKSFGFYDTNISRSIEDQMKGVKDVKQKLIELSLKGAELGDAITWGALWNACEYEVASTKQYKVGTEEFYQEVGKKLRDVVYRTQVVDSTLTRSQMMRSKSGLAQEAAAFMSEPTLSANILMDAGLEFNMEKRRTGSAKVAWKKTGSYIGKAVAVYSISQLAAALLEGLWDAWRDDEDEEFIKKYLDAFIENLALDLVPFNKIPIVSDIFEGALAMFGAGFYSSDKMSSTWLTQAVSAVDAWKDVFSGKSSTTVYNALYKTTRAISSSYGVSFSGAMREVVALWNNTAGAYDSTLKIRQYELSNAKLGSELYEAIISGNTRQADRLKAQFEDQDAIDSAMRKAIKDHFESEDIDYDTAMEYLVEFGGKEEDDAYWTVKEWEYELETGEEFKKYNDFYTAVQTGKDLKAVIKRYTDNGVEAKTLASQITSYFKPLYREMSNTERAAIKGYLLNAYVLLGYSRTEKSQDINNWLKD